MSESPLHGPDFTELKRVDPKTADDLSLAAVNDEVLALVARKPVYFRA